MNTRTRNLMTLALLWLAMPYCLNAQDGSSELVQRIEAVSRQAKSADTSKAYSDIVKECDALLLEKLETESHREHLKTLLAWTLDKRAVSRIDLAEQFRKADNTPQADQIMQQVMQDFARSIENNPQRWQTPLHRGTLYAEQGDYEKAEADFTTVINLQPGSKKAIFNRAEIRYQLKKHAAALSDYQTLVEVDPNDVQSISGRAHCLLAMGNPDDALRDYDRVVRKRSKDGWALINRSDAHLALQQWQEAADDMQAATTLQRNGEFNRRLAWLLATCPDESIADGKKSLLVAKTAIEITGETVENLDTLAAAYAAAGEFERARDVHSRVIAMQQSDDPASSVKQAAYENNERYQEKFDR